MKKNIRNGLLLGAAVLMVGCGQQPADNQYLLKGTIQGVDGQSIYLSYMVNDTTQVVDTALVTNGTFVFNGTLDEPFRRTLLYMGSLEDYNNKRMAYFYLEPAMMTVTLDTARFDRPLSTGSFTQKQSDTLWMNLDVIYKEQAVVSETFKKETDPAKREELQNQFGIFRKRIERTYLDFALTHPDSYLSPEYLQFVMPDMPYEQLKEIYEGFGERVKQIGNARVIERELETLGRLQPGMPAIDFEAIDLNGNPIRFSEAVKGKYVIVDFWASWCVPCRMGMPHLKDLYEKYKDKGLAVVCIAENDRSEKHWREAVEKDGTEAFHHIYNEVKTIDGKPFEGNRLNNISSAYAVHYLPTKYLIDKDFKIVGKMMDEELDAKLKEIFSE